MTATANRMIARTTSYRSRAPPYAMRKPVITSSKMSREPYRSASERRPGRKPASGGMNPPFPITGSTMMAAMGLSASVRSTAARSLNGAVNVSDASDSGTPGETLLRPAGATSDSESTVLVRPVGQEDGKG